MSWWQTNPLWQSWDPWVEQARHSWHQEPAWCWRAELAENYLTQQIAKLPAERDLIWRSAPLRRFYRLPRQWPKLDRNFSKNKDWPSPLDLDDQIITIVLHDAHYDQPFDDSLANIAICSLSANRGEWQDNPNRRLFSSIRPKDQPMVLLNTLAQTHAVQVTSNAPVAWVQIIHHQHLPQSIGCPYVELITQPGQQLHVVEYFIGHAAGQATLATTAIDVAENAQVCYGRWTEHQSQDYAFHHELHGVVDRQAKLQTMLLDSGCGWYRTHQHIALSGDGSSSHGYQLLRGAKKSTVYHRTLVRHLAEQTHSHQLARAIVAEKATSTIHSAVEIQPIAKNSEARQQIKALLLSDTATACLEPQLCIDQDHVLCQHAASVGQLDEQALFYLMSRGLSPAEAKQLLIEAFVTSIFQGLHADWTVLLQKSLGYLP